MGKRNLKFLGSIVSLLVFLALGFQGPAYAAVNADVNADGMVNVLDVQAEVNQLLYVGTYPNADVNGDGLVHVADLQLAINAILPVINYPPTVSISAPVSGASYVAPAANPAITAVSSNTTLAPAASLPPEITGLQDVTLSEEKTSSLSFVVSDDMTALADLVILARSSNQAVIPDTGIVLTGVGRYREVLLSPDQPGNTRLAVTARDSAGNLTTRESQITVNRRYTVPAADMSDSGHMVFSAVVREQPAPRIRLVFPYDEGADTQESNVYRRLSQSDNWGEPIAKLPASALEYVDNNVAIGRAYEYKIAKGFSSFAYLYTGIRIPYIQSRGTIILIVDNTYAADLSPELGRLENDLRGDGWMVIRHDVARHDTPVHVKQLILNDYRNDPAGVKSVFLFGHVPIVYSGWSMPDGHFLRALPADAFYADMNGTWTDTGRYSNVLAGSEQPHAQTYRPETRNFPNDGVYDFTFMPSDVELMIGRVDLFNMPAFMPKTELDLLRQYLNKDHNFRHKKFSLPERFLGDGFDTAQRPIGSALFGMSNVSRLPFNPTLRHEGYLWASRGQFANYHGHNDGGFSTAHFVETDTKAVFMQLFGSYFGEWDYWDDFLRAPLCTPGYTLTSSWDIPYWLYHHMALGEPIGFSAKTSQNNDVVSPNKYRLPSSMASWPYGVHAALMGDPTLRLQPVFPVTDLEARVSGRDVTLSWQEPKEAVEGYHVCRASSVEGPFIRLTPNLVAGTIFVDTGASLGTQVYMVRAVKLKLSASGTYYNGSQGVCRSVTLDSRPHTAAPTIAIGSPANNASVYGHVSVTVTARDNNEVAKVEYYLNDILKATVMEFPYTFVWDTLDYTGGAYRIKAQAYNSSGNFASHTCAVTLVKIDTINPTLSILAPRDGERVWGNVGIHLSATDNAGVERVELWVDGARSATVRSQPYRFMWRTFDIAKVWDLANDTQTVADGNHQVTLKVYDVSGNRVEQSIAVNVDSSLGRPTILRVQPQSKQVQPGELTAITYNFKGGPMKHKYDVFAFFVNEAGVVFRVDSFATPVPGHYWNSQQYSVRVSFKIRRDLAPGRYKIVGGMFNGIYRAELTPGPGVVARPGKEYYIGDIEISPDTTPPEIYSCDLAPSRPFVGSFPIKVKTKDNVAVERFEILMDNVAVDTVTPEEYYLDIEGFYCSFTAESTKSFMERRFSWGLPLIDTAVYKGTYVWNKSGFSNGPHVITIRAYDPSGNHGDLNRNIKVSNLVVYPVALSSSSVPPGGTLISTCHWAGGPSRETANPYLYLAKDGQVDLNLKFKHNFVRASTAWTGGDVTYSNSVTLPAGIAEGRYEIWMKVLTLNDAEESGRRPLELVCGPGVVPKQDLFYKVGEFHVSRKAAPAISNIAD